MSDDQFPIVGKLPHEDKPLRVWWIPQVPMQSFFWPVANLREAKMLLDALALYDNFQYVNSIKGDYSNAGGLVYWEPEVQDEEGNNWTEWDCPETGDDFRDYCESHPDLFPVPIACPDPKFEREWKFKENINRRAP